ncbi:hypothetical protein EXIGLDRAFT_754806, partial [Exidia glandulosa HHB12029]
GTLRWDRASSSRLHPLAFSLSSSHAVPSSRHPRRRRVLRTGVCRLPRRTHRHHLQRAAHRQRRRDVPSPRWQPGQEQPVAVYVHLGILWLRDVPRRAADRRLQHPARLVHVPPTAQGRRYQQRRLVYPPLRGLRVRLHVVPVPLQL